MDVMQAPGAADARQVNWVDGRHILKPDSALVRAALDLLATHVADAAAGTSPRCGQCGRYFPCPTVENARQVVVAGGGLLTVAGKRERKGSAAAVRTEVGDPAARETPVAPVTPKARVEAAPENAARAETTVEAAPAEAATDGVASEKAVEAAPEKAAEAAPENVVEAAPAQAVEAATVKAATDGAPASGPASRVAAGMKVTVTQIPAALVPDLPAPRVPDPAVGHTKQAVPTAGEQVAAPDPVSAA